MAHFHWRGDTLLLDCLIQPRARQTEINGLHADRLKIRLQAPPTDGRANRMLVELLANVTETPVSRVQLVSGQHDRRKRVAIEQPGCLPPGLAVDDAHPASH